MQTIDCGFNPHGRKPRPDAPTVNCGFTPAPTPRPKGPPDEADETAAPALDQDAAAEAVADVAPSLARGVVELDQDYDLTPAPALPPDPTPAPANVPMPMPKPK